MPRPYEDPDILRRMYWDDELSMKEISDKFSCSRSTISRKFDKYGIKRRSRSEAANSYEIDKGTLQHLYNNKKKTADEIALELGCAKSTVLKRMEKYGIKRRSKRDYIYPGYFTSKEGYGKVYHNSRGEQYEVRVHRLCAVAWFGFDSIIGKDIHHKNNIPWDNREENLQTLTHSEHSKLHRSSDDAKTRTP